MLSYFFKLELKKIEDKVRASRSLTHDTKDCIMHLSKKLNPKKDYNIDDLKKASPKFNLQNILTAVSWLQFRNILIITNIGQCKEKYICKWRFSEPITK